MKFEENRSDHSTLEELGRRIARYRLNGNWTQAALAREAGVSKRTLHRLEHGDSIQASNLIRILRALDLLEKNTCTDEDGDFYFSIDGCETPPDGGGETPAEGKGWIFPAINLLLGSCVPYGHNDESSPVAYGRKSVPCREVRYERNAVVNGTSADNREKPIHAVKLNA